MENELVKNLCAKQGFEKAAYDLINNSDIEAFKALVDKSEFLFDFVKQNIVKRLQNSITIENFHNLLKFLSIYSFDYEDLIVSNLKKFADDNVKTQMSDFLKNGTVEEKAYCVKFFEGDSLFTQTFREYSNSDFEPLAYNCAVALGKIKDNISYENAILDLQSDDDFKILSAIKFLSAYQDKNALPFMFDAMKKSSMAENISCEIIYLDNIFNLLKDFPNQTLLLINNIINGLGEVVPLSIVFDIQLYDLIDYLDSPLTLLNIREKIKQLTENDEYLFDEDKSVKEEINDIKKLLNSKADAFWDNLCEELSFDNPDLIFFTLQIIKELNLDYSVEIQDLIEKTTNPTIIVKSIEVMKSIEKIQLLSQEKILSKINDSNIYAIIENYFKH